MSAPWTGSKQVDLQGSSTWSATLKVHTKIRLLLLEVRLCMPSN
jgi:hypothetical protein